MLRGSVDLILLTQHRGNITIIHKMTMTSSYARCCWLHAVGQQVVSNISVIRSCWSICILCFGSNNTNPLLRLLTFHWCTWNVCFATNTNHSLPPQCGGVYLVTMNTEFNYYLSVGLVNKQWIINLNNLIFNVVWALGFRELPVTSLRGRQAQDRWINGQADDLYARVKRYVMFSVATINVPVKHTSMW